MRIITHDDGRCLTLRLLGELDHAAAQEAMPGIEDAVEAVPCRAAACSTCPA